MATVTFAGIPPWDGDYHLDVSSFTNRELHVIKEMVGIRAGELQEAFAANDNDVLVAMAKIAVLRAGKTIDDDTLWDAPVGSVVFDFSEDEPADPPPAAPANGESAAPSGTTSTDGGGEPPNLPSPTGDHG